MRIEDVIGIVESKEGCRIPAVARVGMMNVLHALLDNLETLSCTSDVLDVHRNRVQVCKVLSVDYPYVEETLRDVFALPAVTRVLVHGHGQPPEEVKEISATGKDDENKDDHGKRRLKKRMRRTKKSGPTSASVSSCCEYVRMSASSEVDFDTSSSSEEAYSSSEEEEEQEEQRKEDDVHEEGPYSSSDEEEESSWPMRGRTGRDMEMRLMAHVSHVSCTMAIACTVNAVISLATLFGVFAMWNDIRQQHPHQ